MSMKIQSAEFVKSAFTSEHWTTDGRPEISFLGSSNVGKSSLLNAIAGREAAITTPVPGTTRDIVEVPLALAGRPLLLIDTAGLRDSLDEVESSGVGRAKAMTQTADLVLWLGDPAQAPPRSIRVHAKADILPAPPDAEVAVSSHSKAGLNALIRIMIQRSGELLPGEGDVAMHSRHRTRLREAQSGLRVAADHEDLLIRAEGLRSALSALDSVTGKAGVEQMLDALFGRFCIGK